MRKRTKVRPEQNRVRRVIFAVQFTLAERIRKEG